MKKPKRYFVRTLLKRARLSTCPFCKDKDPSFDSIWVDAAKAYQEGSCSECGAEWCEVYKLVDVTILQAPAADGVPA